MGLVLSKLSGAKGYLIYSTGIQDPDVRNFINATGITNSTQRKAINDLVFDLKTYNIWTKQKALYPVIGGTSATHAVNLRTPGTYNLSFTAGWVHSSTGMTPNGTSDYANTFLAPSILQQNSNHFSLYSRTNSQTGQDAGVVNMGTSPYSRFELLLRYTDNNSYNSLMTQTQNAVTVTDSRGFWIMSRVNSTQLSQFKNNTLYALSSQNSISPSNLTSYIYLGKSNGQSFWSNKEIAFASIGDGLTDTEAANFYTAVQKFQTTLGRQI